MCHPIQPETIIIGLASGLLFQFHAFKFSLVRDNTTTHRLRPGPPPRILHAHAACNMILETSTIVIRIISVLVSEALSTVLATIIPPDTLRSGLGEEVHVTPLREIERS